MNEKKGNYNILTTDKQTRERKVKSSRQKRKRNKAFCLRIVPSSINKHFAFCALLNSVFGLKLTPPPEFLNIETLIVFVFCFISCPFSNFLFYSILQSLSSLLSFSLVWCPPPLLTPSPRADNSHLFYTHTTHNTHPIRHVYVCPALSLASLLFLFM